MTTPTTLTDAEHPIAKKMRERFEAKYGDLSDAMRACNAWRMTVENYRDGFNRLREQPVTDGDVDAAERAMLDAFRALTRAAPAEAEDRDAARYRMLRIAVIMSDFRPVPMLAQYKNGKFLGTYESVSGEELDRLCDEKLASPSALSAAPGPSLSDVAQSSGSNFKTPSAAPANRVPKIDIRPCALCHTNETGFVCTGACDEQAAPTSPGLREYSLDQWWFAELESIHGVCELTMDQYRAVNTARNALRLALAATFPPEPTA